MNLSRPELIAPRPQERGRAVREREGSGLVSPLGENDIHLWVLPIRELLPIDTGDLSGEEAARASRFLDPSDARRFSVVRAAVRRLLSLYLGLAPRYIPIATTPSGRPHLDRVGLPDSRERLNFNISHSRTVAFVVIGRQTHLGIDVEDPPDWELEEIVDLVFDDAERAELDALASSARAEAIRAGWTRKEAVAKALGHGFLTDPRTIRVPLDNAGPWTIAAPGGTPLALADISFGSYRAALAADRIQALDPPRPWAAALALSSGVGTYGGGAGA